ncbi:DUF4124 domain-containing protein [Marinobacter salexigens]|uniref:DUF4124 domain-containing protein n=1 Tax=Marinobacter salexigens TaxID=1925763 RepID=A0ABS6A6H2_9GAMM|nr:DUF4124 domain-containing protein [Marinobacter salexigens]MBU2873777.1 DUF4124 domain-containing protein [Marinobacter salexigens]
MPRILAFVILIVIFSPPTAAEIYRWTDASGAVHFTDTPPSDKNHQSVNVTEPVTVTMSENLGQHRRISGIRKQVQGMLSSDRKGSSARAKSKAKAIAKQEKACASYRRKLAKVQAQLRAGYGISKGNSLRRKRRSLNRAISWECILR